MTLKETGNEKDRRRREEEEDVGGGGDGGGGGGGDGGVANDRVGHIEWTRPTRYCRQVHHPPTPFNI